MVRPSRAARYARHHGSCACFTDAKTLIRLAHLLGPETLKPVLERVVALARTDSVRRGQRREARRCASAIGPAVFAGACSRSSSAPAQRAVERRGPGRSATRGSRRSTRK
jgi:hypothetical protein